MAESLKFYQEIVGLSISRRNEGGPNQIVFLGDGETKVELIYSEANKNIEIGKDIAIGFEIDSVEEKMAFLKEKGIPIHSGPFTPHPGVTFFFIQDPNGLRVQFIQGH